MTDDRLLRRDEVEAQTGLARTTIYRKMRDGTFPEPIKVGARAVRWPASEIRDWLSATTPGAWHGLKKAKVPTRHLIRACRLLSVGQAVGAPTTWTSIANPAQSHTLTRKSGRASRRRYTRNAYPRNSRWTTRGFSPRSSIAVSNSA